MSEENKAEPEGLIPAEDFAKAIAECRKDPQLDALFVNAPQGAKMFLGLLFYSSVFGAKVDERQYQLTLADIETSLTAVDIGYLLRSDIDDDSKDYLRGLLVQKDGTVVPVEPTRTTKLKTVHSQRKHESPSEQKQAASNASHSGISFAEQYAQRSTFEAKVNRGIARALLMKEVVLFACIALVIAGATGIIWYTYHKREMEARAAWLVEQERQKQEQAERLRMEEKRKKEEAARRLAREQELARREEEKKRLRAEEEARRKKEREDAERRRRFAALEGEFRNAPTEYWRNAPKELRPEGIKTDTLYRCLFPDNVDRMAFFDVHVKPKGEMQVKKLSAESEPEDFPTESFQKMCAKTPYLMKVGGNTYFCPIRRKGGTLPIPRESEDLNPSQEEFGELYALTQEIGLRFPKFRYEVELNLPNERNPQPIGQVGFGETLSRGRFRQMIRAELEKEADLRAKEYELAKATKASWGKKPVVQRDSVASLSSWMCRNGYVYGYERPGHIHVSGSLPGRTVYSSSKPRHYGPSRYQVEKQIEWEQKQQAKREARAKREAKREEVKQKRQAVEDARFAEANAVRDEDIEALLDKCTVTFKPVQHKGK